MNATKPPMPIDVPALERRIVLGDGFPVTFAVDPHGAISFLARSGARVLVTDNGSEIVVSGFTTRQGAIPEQRLRSGAGTTAIGNAVSMSLETLEVNRRLAVR